jgi:hypothetical protein
MNNESWDDGDEVRCLREQRLISKLWSRSRSACTGTISLSNELVGALDEFGSSVGFGKWMDDACAAVDVEAAGRSAPQ